MDSAEFSSQTDNILTMESIDEVDSTVVSKERRHLLPKSEQRTSKLWNLFGRQVPRSKAVFFCQIILIYITVLTSLINLTLKNGPVNLWIALLSSCLGYLLPHPSLEQEKIVKE